MKQLIWILLVPALLNARNQPWDLSGKKETWILGSGVALTGFGIWKYLKSQPPDTGLLNKQFINPIDRRFTRQYHSTFSRMSDITLSICTLMPLVVMGVEKNGQKRFQQSVMYGESFLITSGVVALSKGILTRPRPYAYFSNVQHMSWGPDANRSFFSGHTALAFMNAVYCGTIVQHQYPESIWKDWIWITGLTTATTTGLLRILSGQHFPTDVLTGAIFGSIVGWMIPRLHKSDVREKSFQMQVVIPL